MDDMKLNDETSDILLSIGIEANRARRLHGPITKIHEALGVIDEEFFEFKLEVYKKVLDKAAARKELIQLAAMCVKTIEDLHL